MKQDALNFLTLLLLILTLKSVHAIDAVSKWLAEFQPSTLTPEQQRAELQWFVDTAAARGLAGTHIRSTAENLLIHDFEVGTLAPAFSELTGIVCEHQETDEGNLVPTVMEQLRTRKRLVDIYVHDTDSIGTHMRTGRLLWIADANLNVNPILANVTNPGLDLGDWLNINFGQGMDGKIYQLADQQFANLYWFRQDWFEDAQIKSVFFKLYNYTLGVPRTFKSYEDIAEFFTLNCRFPSGFDTIPVCSTSNSRPANFSSMFPVYGHVDYGALSTMPVAPSLGWRYSDAWFVMAGMGDQGVPNGGRGPYPTSAVDDLGIRMDANGISRGSTVARGGEINGHAAVYALNKSLDWLVKYGPSDGPTWEWLDAGAQASRGDIAQQSFMYITWLAKPPFKLYSTVVDNQNTPKWRVAPSMRGRYWDKGMKIGYSDAGAWSIPRSTKGKQLEAAWLWAQFATSKSVDLVRFLAGSTMIRRSTVFSSFLSQRLPAFGGLIEFYRSYNEVLWTPTGWNCPNYYAIATLWGIHLSQAVLNAQNSSQGVPIPQTLQNLGDAMDDVMSRVHYQKWSPELNPIEPESSWYGRSCTSSTTNLPLPAAQCSPKPERGEEADYRWTVEVRPGEDYSSFLSRLELCELDAHLMPTPSCFANFTQ